MSRKWLLSSLALVLILVITTPVNAQDEIVLKGTVLSITIDEIMGDSFTVQTAEEETYTVIPPEGYDLSLLEPGDLVVVTGWYENEQISATNIQVLFNGNEEDNKGGYYCENMDASHPVAERLASQYGVYYEQVMGWFCVDGFGLGEIKNAFNTGMLLNGEVSPEELLTMKEEMGGWGEVWQSLGLIGSGKDKGEMPEDEFKDMEDEHGKPEHPEHPNPDHEPGPPPHANNDKDKDKHD